MARMKRYTAPPASPQPAPPTPSDPIWRDRYPGDGRPQCAACDERVSSIESHLAEQHPHITLQDYVNEFPGRPLTTVEPVPYTDIRPVTQPVEPEPVTIPRVTGEEAEAHPGGRYAAEVAKTLEPGEVEVYVGHVESLAAKGYEPSYALASVAYHMLLVSRIRALVERAKRETRGGAHAGDMVDDLTAEEGRVRQGMKDLSLEAGARATSEDPRTVMEREQAEAEEFVRRHQGEFSGLCPGCQQPLTPPALPHWAFAAIETNRGVEWPVWSAELWRLVERQEIPLWVMAFALRTSPEGLSLTAARRGEIWPDWIVMEAEEVLLRQEIDAADRRALATSGRSAE